MAVVKVVIKQFLDRMEIKSKGMELVVRTPDGKSHRGDLVVTSTGLTWCKGRTTAKNGIKLTWDEFIAWVEKARSGS